MTEYDVQISGDKESLAFAASDLIAQIIESTLKTKSRVKINYQNFRKGEIKKAKIDNSKAISLIKFSASQSFEEGLKKTWEWFNSYKKNFFK